MRYFITTIFFILSFLSFSQSHKFGFDEVLNKNSEEIIPFAVPNNGEITSQNLKKNDIVIKYVTKEYIYFSTTPKKINELYKNKEISDFYFSVFKPELMNDHAREVLHVNPVHLGQNGLDRSYKGDNIIVGYIDTGCDFQHPDFKDENGNSRIIRYWDHNLPVDASRTPAPYGYGQVFDSIDINNGIPIPDCSSTHGTTVAGAGSGNGFANGKHAGTAPNSKIVIVDFNFQAQNWILKVADACDYIFKIADQYNLPAVVNISLGTYFGSHDGNDPASVLMEQLVDEKPGRIIVSSAGNAGSFKNYHIRNQVDSDTSFFWLKNNPSGAFGPNTAFFDLWGTIGQVESINFSFSAVNPNNNYEKRGQTQFYNVLTSFGAPINESIRNSNGDTIAKLTIYSGAQNGAYNMFAYINRIDSTDYYISFNTTGSGLYDAWTGANYGNNYQFVEEIPNESVYPSIIHYVLPDSLQSLVSEWNCSEKILSVANYQNNVSYIDNDGNLQDNSATLPPPGNIAPSSSIGPTRLNVLKPEIASPGDLSFSPGPLCVLENASLNFALFEGGWHMRNGGTSMAAPYIAGIAALYLEKCPKSTYQDFINDITQTAFEDNFTGTLPNFAFGYGKANALELLKATDFNVNIVGANEICTNPLTLSLASNETLETYTWNDGSTNSTLLVTNPGIYTVNVSNNKGCKSSTTKNITQSTPINTQVLISASSNPICIGQEVVFNTSTTNEGSNPTFIWKIDGQVVGNNSPVFTSTTIQNGQTVTCELISSLECVSPNVAISNSIVIQTTGLLPTISIISDHTEVCSGQEVVFSTQITNGGSSPQFQWLIDGNTISQNNSSITLNNLQNNQQVSCILTSNEFCLLANNVTSNQINVSVLPSINPSVQISANKNSICLNEEVQVSAAIENSGQNNSLTWYYGNNSIVNGGTSININSLLPGQFIVCQLNTSGNCVTSNQVLSNYLFIQVVDDAVITQIPGGLTSLTNGISYEWVNCGNNQAIANSNNVDFYPTSSGNYKVRVTKESCVVESICLPVLTNNLNENIDLKAFQIYPNPFDNYFYISNDFNEDIYVSITNVFGQTIYQINLSEKDTKIELRDVADGVYFVEIITPNLNKSIPLKIVKKTHL